MRARPVLPGKTYLLTRRCKGRQFLLRPGDNIRRIVDFAIAKAADKTGVAVHAYVSMSNHIHIVATDPDSVVPDFMRILDLEIAKAAGAEIGNWDGFWAPGTYSRVELLDGQAVVEKVAYVLANPVLAGLVRHASRWPGATTADIRPDTVYVARRPRAGYYANSRQPDSFAFTLRTPVGADPIEFWQHVKAEVRKLEKRSQRRLAGKGRRFVGEIKVTKQNPFDCPASWQKRRGLNPTFASRDRWKRVEAAQVKQHWSAAYRTALTAAVSGVRKVLFPAGTWWMVRFFGYPCAPPPAPG